MSQQGGQTRRTVYACATLAGSRVFQSRCAILTFCCAVSAVNGGLMPDMMVVSSWMLQIAQ